MQGFYFPFLLLGKFYPINLSMSTLGHWFSFFVYNFRDLPGAAARFLYTIFRCRFLPEFFYVYRFRPDRRRPSALQEEIRIHFIPFGRILEYRYRWKNSEICLQVSDIYPPVAA